VDLLNKLHDRHVSEQESSAPKASASPDNSGEKPNQQEQRRNNQFER